MKKNTDLKKNLPPSADSLLEKLLYLRYSCRGFKSECVPKEKIERILYLAQRTASWTNVQPWKVHIIDNEAIEAFRDIMVSAASKPPHDSDLPWPDEYQGIYRDRRRECGWGLYESLGIQKGDRQASGHQAMRNFRFFDAPHIAIITSDRSLGVYGAIDCGAYISNFMLAATSLGIATIAQAALASRSSAIRNYLKLPDDRVVVCGISFGFSDDEHPANSFRTGRAPLNEVISWIE
ncbi:nitroreductase [Candidimonas nitroreducens]|uniref:Nitroreductase n=1 Tax=Candidimonas nitroreducens TaxID=683354 RepID=A0A225MSB2_9BURK|nr:nitroreductase [Candidimonas nitroreducens]OWT63942.1 nitroreductase [Candidimonas nitroreducens]